MDPTTIEALLHEKHISPKAKLEAYLATSLSLRPSSQITIPAEFPNGIEFGKRIDQLIQPRMIRLQQIKDLRTRIKEVQEIKGLLEEYFETIVEGSEEYRTHYDWAERLDLRVNQIKVRPTVHEVYFYRERGVGKKISKLMREREKIRRKVQRKPGDNVNSIRFAYPEEFEPRWLIRLGEALGYPECCVKRYAEDRGNGVNVEQRASQQLLEAVKEGKQIDTHVYYTGYFFPCSPTCEMALEKGYAWHDAFKEMGDELGRLYEQNIYVNAELVLRQPELIQRYLAQFRPKAKD